MALTLSFTNKGKECVFFENYKYRFSRIEKSTSAKTWRCTARACKVLLHTDEDVTKVLRKDHEHVCKEQSEMAVKKNIIRDYCKRIAEDDLEMRPAKIIRSALVACDSTELDFNNVRDLRQNIYRRRRKKLPPNAESQELQSDSMEMREECEDAFMVSVAPDYMLNTYVESGEFSSNIKIEQTCENMSDTDEIENASQEIKKDIENLTDSISNKILAIEEDLSLLKSKIKDYANL